MVQWPVNISILKTDIMQIVDCTKCRVSNVGFRKFRKGIDFCHKLKFLIPLSLQPDIIKLLYFKLNLFDAIELIG